MPEKMIDTVKSADDTAVTDHNKIWKAYTDDKSYKSTLNLYDRVKQQENMFMGKQWEKVKAPDVDKPVINIIKRIVNYLCSVLMVNDVGVSLRQVPPVYKPSTDEKGNVVNAGVPAVRKVEEWQDIVSSEFERVNETVKFREKTRFILRDGAVRGDAGMYTRYVDKDGVGDIEVELVDNTHIHFGDRQTPEVEKQPFIIISKTDLTSTLKKKYPERADIIVSDTDDTDSMGDEVNNQQMTTVLIHLRKVDGRVHCCEVCQRGVLTEEFDTGLTRYPLCYMNWERVKDSYHGIGVVEEVIPNQIAINKLWALVLLHTKNMAFPKVFYDRGKIDKWTNKVGAAIAVSGNPNDAIASSFRAFDMSNQVLTVVDKTVAFTKEFMGANDAALGNVNPDNTSAIIALQKATAAPLDLQRQSYYRFIESYVRIVYEIIREKYGRRYILKDIKDEGSGQIVKVPVEVDFSALPSLESLIVDIGPSDYWSELTQTATMDNLFKSGILTDAEAYIESVPDKNIKNKDRVLQAVKERKEKQRQQEEAQRQMMMLNNLPK